MPRLNVTLPEESAAELQRRARAEDRSEASLIRLAVRQLLFGAIDGAALGRDWRLEEDWHGLWAVRDKPNHPGVVGVVERVLLEDGPAGPVERPAASMHVCP